MLLGLLVASLPVAAPADEARWWPVEAVPRALVQAPNQEPYLVQSLAGLAAQAVNEGRGDELVWVETGNADLEDWYARFRRQHPEMEVRATFGPWELVERYVRRGIVKGYILYRLDRSRGALNEYRPAMDCSVNVGTSLAGLLGGVLIEEGQEPEARRRGLRRLLDARDKTQQWCFETYRDRFSRRLLCTQDPRKPHARDLAIAQRAFTVYGDGPPTAAALRWVEPPAPILGWNGGDEFRTTRRSSVHGHVQTATDWCMNLPVLMAGSERAAPPRGRPFDPRGIDWGDRRSAVCFVSSDGDNVQWQQGSFFRNRSYWASPDRGRLPFGWSCCFTELAQLCPQAIAYAQSTQSARDEFVEWGGGYYYPDLFGLERPDRWGLLARHARRTWALMRQTGTRVIGLNFARPLSADARKACEVFARQTDGLLAILAIQYDPYEGGAGATYWVRDARGVEVPVITARYALWEHRRGRPRSGTPAKVAREVRATLAATPAGELPRYDWAVVHAWSYFRRAPGGDERAEDLPGKGRPDPAAVRGYTPVTWCAERLPADVRVIGPEELAWRVRMQHNPAETRRAIREFRP